MRGLLRLAYDLVLDCIRKAWNGMEGWRFFSRFSQIVVSGKTGEMGHDMGGILVSFFALFYFLCSFMVWGGCATGYVWPYVISQKKNKNLQRECMIVMYIHLHSIQFNSSQPPSSTE